MKTAIFCLMASLLTGAPAAVVAMSTRRPPPAVTCEPGASNCTTPEGQMDESSSPTSERHPCDWVETCQLPCGREGGECCHAEWSCPPDANLPRC
ncbi:hypothetical protein JRI60_49790 [Archangium violaceum]|uniref:hypothetical protein n=1 Tax=Archangium violaceum TaxID=83451 RepID=UPI001950BE37|nr:hypothetical protein [Archangium violaceum]QRN96975.1 hypothetical protein JRI60_49790 [Archangium violaceum]